MERAEENQERGLKAATAEAVGHLGLGCAARWYARSTESTVGVIRFCSRRSIFSYVPLLQKFLACG